MADTPRRKIIHSTTGYVRRTRAGIIRTTVPECGHLTETNATQRRRGWVYCFDCYYNKPVSALGKVLVEEYAAKSTTTEEG